MDISITGAKGVLLSIAGGEDLGLLEVQAAAQIVTESIDKNAKVIFGTSKDERLRKGEVRVTVIATGFPEDGVGGSRQSLFQAPQRKEVRKDDDSAMGKIYNTMVSPIKDEEAVPPISEKKSEPTPKPADDEDEWGVPAFLRRSKK